MPKTDKELPNLWRRKRGCSSSKRNERDALKKTLCRQETVPGGRAQTE